MSVISPLAVSLGLLALGGSIGACAGIHTPSTPAAPVETESSKYSELIRVLIDTIDWQDVCPKDAGCGEVRLEPAVYRAVPEGLRSDSSLKTFGLSEADLAARSSPIPFRLSSSKYQDGDSFATATFAVWMESDRPASMPSAYVVIFSPRYTGGLSLLVFAHATETTWQVDRIVQTPY